MSGWSRCVRARARRRVRRIQRPPTRATTSASTSSEWSRSTSCTGSSVRRRRISARRRAACELLFRDLEEAGLPADRRARRDLDAAGRAHPALGCRRSVRRPVPAAVRARRRHAVIDEEMVLTSLDVHRSRLRRSRRTSRGAGTGRKVDVTDRCRRLRRRAPGEQLEQSAVHRENCPPICPVGEETGTCHTRGAHRVHGCARDAGRRPDRLRRPQQGIRPIRGSRPTTTPASSTRGPRRATASATR